MPARPRIGFYGCASCGGCEEALLDLGEGLLDLLDQADIAFCPALADFRRSDVEAMPDGHLAVTLVNGCVRTSEQEAMARLLRRKSRLLVACGSCAQSGGVPALANLVDRERLMGGIYGHGLSVDNPLGARPAAETRLDGHTFRLPAFRRAARTLDQIVDVDYCVPGCPPAPDVLREALRALLDRDLPAVGSVLAPDIALCAECPLEGTRTADLALARIRRVHQTAIDPQVCLLEQGFVCMGPATRGGCGAPCIRGGMPCTGCSGPTSRVPDQGSKMLSSLASSLAGARPREILAAADGLPDPVGTLYRYGLAGSLLRGRVPGDREGSGRTD